MDLLEEHDGRRMQGPGRAGVDHGNRKVAEAMSANELEPELLTPTYSLEVFNFRLSTSSRMSSKLQENEQGKAQITSEPLTILYAYCHLTRSTAETATVMNSAFTHATQPASSA